MSKLFSPIAFGQQTLSNRIVIAPMCQYSAVEGQATDWHLIHLGHLALSGAGLLYIEATAITPEGRISPSDLGLYSDETEAALARVLKPIRQHSAIPIAIQLAHAGRKASTQVPWEGGKQIAPANGGWQTEAPSALPWAGGELPPVALDHGELLRIRDAFVSSAQRAHRLGIEVIELHAAHGYLLHQFLSPLSNARTDQYGGPLENRMRFPLDVFEAVRAAVPADMPVGVRISATDWIDGGWEIEQSIAVGLITEPEQAEQIVASGQADMVALARGMLYDPRWPWHAAAKLGAQVAAPKQYWRSQPAVFRNLFKP